MDIAILNIFMHGPANDGGLITLKKSGIQKTTAGQNLRILEGLSPDISIIHLPQKDQWGWLHAPLR
jgi:hypothetical protein